MSTVGKEEDGGTPSPGSVLVYSIGGDLMMVVHAEIAFKAVLTHDDVRLQVANAMHVPPGLLKFVALGRETDSVVLHSDEDMRNVSDLQVAFTLEKRDSYLQGSHAFGTTRFSRGGYVTEVSFC